MPKIGQVSNSNAVTKDTIWQRVVRESGPFEGAGLFACLLSCMTIWLTNGSFGPVATAVGFVVMALAVAFSAVSLRQLLIPIIAAISAVALIVTTGGMSGAVASACLWPLLVSGSLTKRQTGQNSVLIGIAASFGTLVASAVISQFISPPADATIAAQAGILAMGVSGAFAIAAGVTWQTSKAKPLDSRTQDQITGLERERDLAHAETALAYTQTQARAQFMAEMSHEIRTPLNAILGFADTMREGVFGPLPDAYGDYPELIHTSGSHLLDLVSDLLDLSKIEAGRYDLALKEQRLDALVLEGVKLSGGAARANGVQIRHEASGPISVEADARAMRQIILNLMSNAIKFTPRDGRIYVRLATDPDTQTASLEIEDTGSGIADSDLSRIGEPWNQVSHEQTSDAKQSRGSGLGLALVKRLAHLQSGRLDLSSILGVGTIARITLPLSVTTSKPPS